MNSDSKMSIEILGVCAVCGGDATIIEDNAGLLPDPLDVLCTDCEE